MLTADIHRVASQILSSRVLTDEQIRSVTNGIGGTFFSDWLATPMTEATASITGIQSGLETQSKQLNQVIKDMEAKKKAADHYAALAKLTRKPSRPSELKWNELLESN